MIQVSNKQHLSFNNQITSAPSVQYIDRIVEVLVEAPSVEPVVQILEVPIDRIVEVERIVHVEAPQIDLNPLHVRLDKHESALIELHSIYQNLIRNLYPELEMQRRALVAIKTQRDIDRNRRLILLKRIKKEQNAHRKTELKLKLAIAASLTLSIVSLIVKL